MEKLAEEIEEARKKYIREGESALKNAFKEFFSENPMAKAVMWTQYTPYWNDGEACTFSVNTFELKIDPSQVRSDINLKDNTEEYCHGDGCASGFFDHKKGTPAEKKLVKEFEALEAACYRCDEVLLDVFGDHVLVVATAEGFKVEEWDHD